MKIWTGLKNRLIGRLANVAGRSRGENASNEAERLCEVVATRLKGNEARAMKAVRAVTGLGLRDVSDILQNLPRVVNGGLTRKEADSLADRLRKAGLEVVVKPRANTPSSNDGDRETHQTGPSPEPEMIPGGVSLDSTEKPPTSDRRFARDIEERIARDFPGGAADHARGLLYALRGEPGDRLSPRVIRAIIFLSEGNLETLKETITAAKKDFRDVLFWAEYADPGTGDQTRVRDFNKPFGAH